MEKNISIQEYYKIILYLYQLKNTLNILVALYDFCDRTCFRLCRIIKYNMVNISIK